MQTDERMFTAPTMRARMAFGAHYLSDALLAGLVMLVIVQGTRMLLFPDRDPS